MDRQPRLTGRFTVATNTGNDSITLADRNNIILVGSGQATRTGGIATTYDLTSEFGTVPISSFKTSVGDIINLKGLEAGFSTL